MDDDKIPSVNNGNKATIEILDFKGLSPLLHKQDDTLRVVNFWATWCKPCVAELPAFAELQETYQDKQLKIYYVSLDFPSQMDKKLIPFVEKHDMTNVILLDDPKSNTWIPLVDDFWSGAIPATLIYRKGKRHFYESGFTYSGLKEAISGYDL
ncbi:MAG: TlpA disulfide reductase family protein [Leeuwenhoekiella sp.]